MPIYQFHVDGVSEAISEDIATLAEAKCEAVRYAGELICDSAGEFWNTGQFRLTVSDATGLTLFLLEFSATEAPAIRTG